MSLSNQDICPNLSLKPTPSSLFHLADSTTKPLESACKESFELVTEDKKTDSAHQLS